MAEFEENIHLKAEENDENNQEEQVINTVSEEVAQLSMKEESVLIDVNNPVNVIYCGVCSMPPEFCEFGATYERCLAWATEKCPELLNKAQDEAGEEGDKKRKKVVAGPKKAAAVEVKVVIGKIQRQKKKYITVVNGLETIPNLKIKDAAKLFGKKFSSGASVNDNARGEKEITIQGDVSHDLPQLLINEYKIAPNTIYFSDNGTTLTPYHA